MAKVSKSKFANTRQKTVIFMRNDHIEFEVVCALRSYGMPFPTVGLTEVEMACAIRDYALKIGLIKEGEDNGKTP